KFLFFFLFYLLLFFEIVQALQNKRTASKVENLIRLTRRQNERDGYSPTTRGFTDARPGAVSGDGT
ncbi:hypothetical protein, partial [Cronobacter sakazakii]|uniref:hypothetical protein n=1 Tax=Cronobacter sakazakii TaxID=28141 RepID=UPI001959A411